jgi:hypothetical protein
MYSLFLNIWYNIKRYNLNLLNKFSKKQDKVILIISLKIKYFNHNIFRKKMKIEFIWFQSLGKVFLNFKNSLFKWGSKYSWYPGKGSVLFKGL